MKRPAEDNELPSSATKKAKKDKKSKRDKKTKKDADALPSSSSPIPSPSTASEATRRDDKKAKKAKKARKEQRKDRAAVSVLAGVNTPKKEDNQSDVEEAAAKDKRAHKRSKDTSQNEDNEKEVKHKKDHKHSKDRARNGEVEAKVNHEAAPELEPSSLLPSTSTKAVPFKPGNAAAATTGVFDNAVEMIIARVAQDGSPTLSDLLNPDHGAYDATLKAQWKTLPKKGRAAIVAADLRRIANLRRAGEDALTRLPYETEPDDHCESPPEAYADLAPFLDLVAAELGKTRATLEIYDPYFCTGAMKKHLGALGFTKVHNECVDFYEMIRLNTVPAHDVLVTNPPYSTDHVSRLLQFCSAPGSKPYCLLMPNYVAAKPYFSATFSGLDKRQSTSSPSTAASRCEAPVLVCPRKRYNYWTPKGLRAAGKVQGHVSSLGHRTSPFISYWYVHLGPVVPKRDLLKQRAALTGQTLLLCESFGDFPSALRP